jgi:hypothetical protein
MWPPDPTSFVAASGGAFVPLVGFILFFVLVIGILSFGATKLLGWTYEILRNEAEFDPIYGVAGGSLDLREYRDSEAGEFTHEVVDRRGADLVVAVDDGTRTGRFLVPTDDDQLAVVPASSGDYRHEDAWVADVVDYLEKRRDRLAIPRESLREPA